MKLWRLHDEIEYEDYVHEGHGRLRPPRRRRGTDYVVLLTLAGPGGEAVRAEVPPSGGLPRSEGRAAVVELWLAANGPPSWQTGRTA